MSHEAILREVPDSFPRALVRHGRPALDTDRARAQHVTYRRLIEDAGYLMRVLTADETHPDCLFVEDTAVVVGNTAVITRPGAPSRRGEIEPVAAELGKHLHLVRMTAPATLDGGDVFIMNGRLYVGRSQRTNQEGIDQLGEVATANGLEVVAVDVAEVLHLKSAVHPIDAETVVVTPGTVDVSLLDDLRIVSEDPAERHRFSSLPLRNGVVVTSAGSPRTNELLSGRGFEVAPIDVSEIKAADGGLTCMSILFDTSHAQWR